MKRNPFDSYNPRTQNIELIILVIAIWAATWCILVPNKCFCQSGEKQGKTIIQYNRLPACYEAGDRNFVSYSTAVAVSKLNHADPDIKIYDMTGRCVSTTGDATYLQPGIYVAEIRSDHFKLIIK